MLNVSNVRVAYQTLNIDRAERVEKNPDAYSALLPRWLELWADSKDLLVSLRDKIFHFHRSK